MRWFGFGFNAFGQICDRGRLHEAAGSDVTEEIKVLRPAELDSCCCSKISGVRASWSRRANVHENGDSCVCVAGFDAASSSQSSGVSLSHGCKDASISEQHLTLAFPDRIESWDLQRKDQTPSWSTETDTQSESSSGCPLLNLPLVPGGYMATKPPLFRSLSPHLKAKSLALGGDHAVLLCASGAMFTWGLGSHGQLGHGGLTSEEEPRAVEALWGMTMSAVAAGGWHSVAISDGGDLYLWGWNESGQIGLPSRGLRKTMQQQSSQQAGALCEGDDVKSGEDPQEGEKHQDVFISIQAFPALLDVTTSCEIRTVSCGSRHTAAVTTTGDLYTWGWGEYGQLGHQTLISSDEPQRVEFFREQQMRVVDVVCGTWNTFAAVIKEDVPSS